MVGHKTYYERGNEQLNSQWRQNDITSLYGLAQATNDLQNFATMIWLYHFSALNIFFKQKSPFLIARRFTDNSNNKPKWWFFLSIFIPSSVFDDGQIIEHLGSVYTYSLPLLSLK